MPLNDNFHHLSAELLELIINHGADGDRERAKAALQALEGALEHCYAPVANQTLPLTVSARVTAYTPEDAAALLRNELRSHFRGPAYELPLFPREPRIQNLVLICNPKELKRMRIISARVQDDEAL